MDELLAKLTNLSYDFFGILLPGIIINIFILILWAALGPLVPFWTATVMPELSIVELKTFISSLGHEGKIIAAILLIFFWYFLGHSLHWCGRSGKRFAGKISGRTRVGHSLLFQIPKPQYSYDTRLEPLYQATKKKFTTDGVDLEWGQFFPVVKVYLAQRVARSLVATYQTKYTLHRSITVASTILFWLSLLGFIVGLVMFRCYSLEPHWPPLIFLIICSAISVWGFSGSYLYNWELFGNSIVTEAYSHLHGPKDEQSSK